MDGCLPACTTLMAGQIGNVSEDFPCGPPKKRPGQDGLRPSAEMAANLFMTTLDPDNSPDIGLSSRQ